MHPLYADFYRLADLDPTVETLDLREKAIEEFLTTPSLDIWLDCVRLFIDVPNPKSAFKDDFANLFKGKDPRFSLDENEKNEHDLRVLAGIALIEFLHRSIEQPSYRADAIGLALVCADFRGEGHQGIIPQALPIARAYLNHSARDARDVVEDSNAPPKPLEFSSNPTKALKNIEIGDIPNHQHWNVANTNFEQVKALNGKLISAVKKLHSMIEDVTSTLNELIPVDNRDNHLKVLQEELDVLWWLFGEHSRDLDKHMSVIGMPEMCAVAARELADLTTLEPGFLQARAVLDKALHIVTGAIPESVTIKECVNSLHKDWCKEWTHGLDLNAISPLAPGLTAITNFQDLEGDGWIPPFEAKSGLDASLALTPLSLAHQLYEEAIFVRIVERLG